ncbi:MAG: hypothetical protein O2826_04170 [Chloroflexi bacterium]|nr:hypothetical protein [Chloroflexota bacterium]MDA1173699.1 hypothetical protein [Chloroflexota bacterium]
MSLARAGRIVGLILVLMSTLSVFVGCSTIIAKTPIQIVAAAARDHSIHTLTTGDTSYLSRKLIMVRSSGTDLRAGNDGTANFELHHEALYERKLPDFEQVTVSTWREYGDEPGVRYPAAECEQTVVIDITDSFDKVCDGTWMRDAMIRGPADVVADLRKVIDIDALTRVEDAEYRGMRTGVYEGFHSERGELKLVAFMIGMDDGIIRWARLAGATMVVEWEHFDITGTPSP